MIEILGNVVIFFNVSVTIIGPALVYCSKAVMFPKMHYRNYNHDMDLLEQYKAIKSTNKLSDKSIENFDLNLLDNTRNKGFDIVFDNKNIVVLRA